MLNISLAMTMRVSLMTFYANQAKQYPNSLNAVRLAAMKKVLDRWHLKNHMHSCRQIDLNPDFFKELNGVNTKVAEQFFSHLLKFVKLFTNTTPERAKFSILLIILQ